MTNPWIILGILVVITVVVILAYIAWPLQCPTEIRTLPDGQILIKSTGKSFENKDEFQKWWDHSEFKNRCALPDSLGKSGRNVEKHDIQPEKEKEKTYATTPINKVDDYEFSRIFGTEVNGHMILEEDYNRILFDRTQDWVNKPYSSDERKQITETFVGNTVQDQVKDLVLKAYSSEPDYEPVITQVGENQWEVNELKPKLSSEAPTQAPTVDAHASFQYRSAQDVNAAIDPYFTGLSGLSGHAGRYGPKDPFGGPVPGMERMFGPTLDTTRWA